MFLALNSGVSPSQKQGSTPLVKAKKGIRVLILRRVNRGREPEQVPALFLYFGRTAVMKIRCYPANRKGTMDIHPISGRVIQGEHMDR